MIGGHANVFEDISAQQETYVVREGIKCLSRLNQSGCDRQRVEAVVKVDRRASDGRASKSRPKEPDVSLLINRDLLGKLLDGGGLEGYCCSADDIAGGSHAVDIGARKTGPDDRDQIIFGLQILQVQGEVQNIRVTRGASGLRPRWTEKP